MLTAKIIQFHYCLDRLGGMLNNKREAIDDDNSKLLTFINLHQA